MSKNITSLWGTILKILISCYPVYYTVLFFRKKPESRYLDDHVVIYYIDILYPEEVTPVHAAKALM